MIWSNMALSWFNRDWVDREKLCSTICAWKRKAQKLLTKQKKYPLFVCYPAVIVQQTSRDDCVQEDFMSSDDVVEILGLLHFIPQLIPGALQHLHTHTHTLYLKYMGMTLLS